MRTEAELYEAIRLCERSLEPPDPVTDPEIREGIRIIIKTIEWMKGEYNELSKTLEDLRGLERAGR